MPFARSTLADLVTRTRADVQSRISRDDALRWDDSEVYARVLAGASDALFGYLDWLSRQLIYDSAEAEWLERWAAIWGIFRKPAAAATGSVTFTGSDGAAIPSGTLLSAWDGVQYATTADAVIAAGTAAATVEAVIPAAAGNRTSGETLTLTTPIPGVTSAATAAELSAGADVESDDDLRARFLARIRNQPQGGSFADYVQWALEVPGVTRAWATSALGAGTVTVRFVRDDDASIIPDAGEVAAVQAHIEGLRPVTAAVTVIAPTAVTQDIDITTPAGVNAADKATIEAAIAAVLAGVEPGGTLYVEQLNQEVIAVAGQYAHFIADPAADVDYSAGQIPTLGAVTWL
jgi:uncharacterized phage protein gp47/JayE